MEEINTEISKETMLDTHGESHQDFIENDASDYESINSGNEDNYRKEHNSDYESDTLQDTERQEGDGQESIPPKRVDDDEDKKNPQYIPKRGTFYEHDDRTLEDEEEGTAADKKERQSKKSIWIEKKERWGHDRFNENDQAPKSRSELIGIYGYDIRNEDGPPRARRRRRYGRGPNKYTRNWEDEDAYRPIKPVKVVPKKTKEIDDTLSLETQNDNEEIKETVEERNTNPVEIKPAEKEIINNISKPNGVQQTVEKIKPTTTTTEIVPVVKVPQTEFKPSDYRGFTKARQFKNSQMEQKIVKKQEKVQVPAVLEDNFANLTITKKQNRQNTIPPRLQNEQKGPKRYSSLRQRSLPETAATTAFNQQTYYANDYTPPQPQQAILTQPAPATVIQQIPPAIQPVPVTATALLPTPTQFGPPFPPPGFIPAPVPPPPFIPPQPQIINYVPSQPQFAQPPPFQGFQHQQFNTVAPPAELNYQCQGGTTYYSTQNQQIGHAPLLRRPKAAIPIVPPPAHEEQTRDITSITTDSIHNGMEVYKENYDDFQENDYEDANIVVQ